MNSKSSARTVSALIILLAVIGLVNATLSTWARTRAVSTSLPADGAAWEVQKGGSFKSVGYIEEKTVLGASIIVGAAILAGYVLIGLANLLLISERIDKVWGSLTHRYQSSQQIVQAMAIGCALVLAGTFSYPILYDAKLETGWTYASIMGIALAVLIALRWFMLRAQSKNAGQP